MIVTKINILVAFSCLLMGMTDLHEKKKYDCTVERLDYTSWLKEKYIFFSSPEPYFH